MRNASGHNYWNSSFIMDVAMAQIPRSTECISSCQSFGCFLLLNQIYLTTVYHSTIPLQFSVQSAVEIRFRTRVRVALFLHFLTENNENDHVIFRKFYGRQHLAKRTHRNGQQQNKITYSRSAYE